MSQVRTESQPLIRRLLDELLVPGISLALVDEQGPVWVESFGVSNRDTGEVMSIDSVFRVGSLSKPITALAVMQLQAAGRIGLDSPLEDQLADFAIKRQDGMTGDITPRQLLSHLGGLPSDLRKGMFTDTPFSHVVEQLHETYLTSPPGTRYNYSNLGYDLLGQLVEQHARQDYPTYVHDNLTGPLGMSHSGFSHTPEISAKLSAGHRDDEAYPLPPLRDLPALGFYTSAQDMGRLLTALLRGNIPGLSPAVFEQMWEEHALTGESPDSTAIGLGWFIENPAPFGRLIRHGGTTMLFSAELALLPDTGLGVVVMANGAGSQPLTRELAATILSLAAHARGHVPSDRQGDRPKQLDTTPGYPEGGYATSLGLLMIDPQKPKLCACIIERILDLTRFDDGSFALTRESAASLPESYRILGGLRLRTRQSGDQELLLAEIDGRETVLGNKIDPTALNEHWRQRIGVYRTINPDKQYSLDEFRLSEEGGVLCLHYRAPYLNEQEVRLPIKPIADDQAVIQGLGRGAGEIVEIVVIDGRACLRFSGYISMPTVRE